MERLDTITVNGGLHKRIELYQGDLTDLSPAEAFDLLVVSAFPNDYFPSSDSLIGALYRKGLSVQALAQAKALDLRANFSCWLSAEFTAPNEALRFHRLLCFEPLLRGKPPELVGDIFRALAPILAEQPAIKTIAMPLLAAGDQGYSVHDMLTPLLDACLQWLEHGLPLDCIKIVIHGEADAQVGLRLFSARRVTYEQPPNPEPVRGIRDMEYDVFISYARENAKESEVIERALRQAKPDIRIFLDQKELDIGSAWQPEIFETLDHCYKVVALLSPAYLESKVCKEEFNIAWIRARETDQDVIFPVYIYTAELPTYMKYRNFIDCREGDPQKLSEASTRLLHALAASLPPQAPQP